MNSKQTGTQPGYPTIKEMIVNQVLTIYKDYRNQEIIEGTALLIKHEPSLVGNEKKAYVKEEQGGTEKQDSTVVQWKAQRWRIKFLTGEYTGFITHRYIAYFFKKGGR